MLEVYHYSVSLNQCSSSSHVLRSALNLVHFKHKSRDFENVLLLLYVGFFSI